MPKSSETHPFVAFMFQVRDCIVSLAITLAFTGAITFVLVKLFHGLRFSDPVSGAIAGFIVAWVSTSFCRFVGDFEKIDAFYAGVGGALFFLGLYLSIWPYLLLGHNPNGALLLVGGVMILVGCWEPSRLTLFSPVSTRVS